MEEPEVPARDGQGSRGRFVSVKQYSAAAERNSDGILQVLKSAFPLDGLVLEVASGTGYHAAVFSKALPALRWQPTDRSPEALQSIRAWGEEIGGDNLLEPLHLDVLERPWPVESADALLCVNMIHISPWACTESLFEGASRILGSGSALVTYGPYRVEGEPFAPSNASFDESLRRRNPAWGIRSLGEVCGVAEGAGFSLEKRHDMAANNLCLVFRRS